MKVITAYEPARQGTNIYIYLTEPTPGKPGLALGPDRFASAVEVPYGSEPPLFLFLDDRIKDALLEQFRPRVDPSERHLQDALSIRNRLMTLIEADAMNRASGGESIEWIQSRVGS